jgi:hypothetical protein
MNPPTNQELAAEAVQALHNRGLHAYADAIEAQNKATANYLKALQTIAALTETALNRVGHERTVALEAIRDRVKDVQS